MNTAKSTAFIVFSDDWGVHMSSAQHIFRRICQRYDVAWINTVGMRRPTFTRADFDKARRKLAGMFAPASSPPAEPAPDRVRVYQPPMLPVVDSAAGRWLNKISVRKAMRRAVRDMQAESVIVVSTVPNACDYVDAVPCERIVYYCVDDFSEWPGLDKSKISRMEDDLVGKCDVFLATSQSLYERLAATGKPTELLTHGVDIAHFSSQASEEYPGLRGIPGPRIGFFGLFDDRSDQHLIAELAQKLPAFSFVIAGKVETQTARLKECPNIHFLGPIPYPQLPGLVKGLDVLMIPYLVNALSDALSPLKLKEYLVTGRPVVSTPIAAALELRDELTIARSAEEWADSLAAALDVDWEKRQERQVARLSGESWEAKAELMLEACLPNKSHRPADQRLVLAEN